MWGELSARTVSRADAWPRAGCSGMLPCCPSVDGTSLGSGPGMAERPVLIMEACEREGHFPALQASLLSVHPQSLFLRLIKALWNLDSFLFSCSLFTFLVFFLFLRDTVVFILLAL